MGSQTSTYFTGKEKQVNPELKVNPEMLMNVTKKFQYV